MKNQIITGIRYLLVVTLFTGLIYPALVTITDNILFRQKAEGSLVRVNNTVTGSLLIGQKFTSPKYFWSRPSETGYNAMPSGGSNLAQSNPKLREEIISRLADFSVRNNISETGISIPAEMVTESASGLDPHISPQAALLQVDRIARARGMTDKQKQELNDLVHSMIEKKQFSLLGEPRINVLLLNLKLDNLK